jgi:NTE family protein
MTHADLPPRPDSYNKKIALVLQGGGALGSYQAGVYEALDGSGYEPDWVAGISIGAINAAIIAGNAPEHRVEKLRRFWETVTAPPGFWPAWLDGFIPLPSQRRQFGSAQALLFGQSGFFGPHAPMAWLAAPPPTSYYDTSALKTTLEALVDFERINSGNMRLSVGAVNVHTGNFAYFDSAELAIRPEHIMASSALPPAFPAVEIDGEYYWDGGLVSNTPLQYVLTKIPRVSRLTFQVDVFHARGAVPTTLAEAAEREKDIRYSSRTRAATDAAREIHDVRHNINTLWDKLPDELRDSPEGRFLYNFSCVTTMDIAQIIYRPTDSQGQSKDYEFSRATMEERWAQGLADAAATLKASPWLEPAPPELGARTFDVLGTPRVPTAPAARVDAPEEAMRPPRRRPDDPDTASHPQPRQRRSSARR